MTVVAELNGVEVARSDRTVVVEGNHYFPVDDVDPAALTATSTRTTCPWKGVASYWTVTAGGTSVADAAWAYPTPSDAARQIAGRLAFWRGVVVREV
ncbi:DUF427 domain-containing protein [Actinotalea sp.]|uniref:DUF427 domain-containing protein n=1 Tax=Actinotalea sp. TaxID=1872145 RepID=UPI002C9E8E7B|nr:DUF427 domain-containing protein [Actinotalea sp.]HQY32453.1 DUF427 domain-containing protein [Actinotalea sp.]HRA49521.1 DUF427 domain-containing protein [Actinotalea sp.]